MNPKHFLERQTIVDYHPKIIPSGGDLFNLNITLNKEISLFEGSIYLVFQSSTKDDTRFEVGKLQNVTNFQHNITSFVNGGIFHFELFYQNPNSFEFRSMFSISDQRNISFSSKSSISLISERNMFYLNQIQNITLKIDNIDSIHLSNDQISRIKCKLGNEYVETLKVSNDVFVCSLISTTAKFEQISLFYKSDDAFNGEILISNNQIDIIFIRKAFYSLIYHFLEKISIQSIVPFATLKSTMNPVLNVNYLNIYGSSVSYKCLFGNSKSVAILQNNQFNCTFDKIGSNAYSLNASILVVSTLKNNELLLSSNQQEFFFLSKKSILI